MSEIKTEKTTPLTILITGADRGIGLALCRTFLAHGDRVFAGRYLRRWHHLRELQHEYPDRLSLIDLDISSEDSVRAAAAEVAAKTEVLDIIINNAGIIGNYSPDIFSDQDYENMLQVYNVNALGPVRVTQHFIRLMLKGRGRLIVNISSEAGSIGTCWRDDGYGYCMSKAALNMASSILHNSLYRAHRIQVVDIHPGGVASQMGQGAWPDQPQTDQHGHLSLAPQQSADAIFALILDQERFKSDHPASVNFRGDKIPW